MMYGGVFALIWKGLTNPQIGGLTRVWQIASDSGRLTDFLRVDPSLFQVRFWNFYSL